VVHPHATSHGEEFWIEENNVEHNSTVDWMARLWPTGKGVFFYFDPSGKLFLHMDLWGNNLLIWT
jgi:hypothetical protein